MGFRTITLFLRTSFQFRIYNSFNLSTFFDIFQKQKTSLLSICALRSFPAPPSFSVLLNSSMPRLTPAATQPKTVRYRKSVESATQVTNDRTASCPADPALGKTINIDFTAGGSDDFTQADGTHLRYDTEYGALFNMSKETDAPTITSNDYIMFGRVDVVMRASPGQGVISSVVLESDDLDEIDWVCHKETLEEKPEYENFADLRRNGLEVIPTTLRPTTSERVTRLPTTVPSTTT